MRPCSGSFLGFGLGLSLAGYYPARLRQIELAVRVSLLVELNLFDLKVHIFVVDIADVGVPFGKGVDSR